MMAVTYNIKRLVFLDQVIGGCCYARNAVIYGKTAVKNAIHHQNREKIP